MSTVEAIPSTYDGLIAEIIISLGAGNVTQIRQNDWLILDGKRYFAELHYVVGADPLLGFINSCPDTLDERDAHRCVMSLTYSLIESVKVLQMPPIVA